MRTVLAWALAASTMILGACRVHHGPRWEQIPVATTAAGATLELRATERGGAEEAELIAVQDSGLVVASSGRLVFAPYASLRTITVKGLGWRYEGPAGASNADVRRQLRPLSRFPQGMSPDVVSRLLEAYGQTSIEAFR